MLLLAIIYLAFISLGLPDSLVGAGWPAMHESLGVPLSCAGFITFIIATGTIISSLMSDRLTTRFGPGRVTAASVALTAAALFGFSFSTQFWVLCLWAMPYGLGAGTVDAALNNYAALHYTARHMNWLHGCWGLGASISPFIMSQALSSGHGWPSAYRTVGTLQAILTAIVTVSLPLWNKTRKINGGGSAKLFDHVPTRAALATPGVPAVLGAFFSYCAVESTSMLWAASYLVSVRGTDGATAAAFASLFVLGITAGRFLAGFVAERIGDRMLVRGGFITVGVGVVLVGLPGVPSWVALAGLVIAGLGSAPIYPAIIHSTPTTFGAHNSQAIIGIQMAAAYVVTTLAPPTVRGDISQHRIMDTTSVPDRPRHLRPGNVRACYTTRARQSTRRVVSTRSSSSRFASIRHIYLEAPMAVPVDFTTVSAQGLETSEHPEALAGLRANEARYFHNKFKHTFEVSPASEEPYALAWVTQILAEERDITIASPALEISINDVEGIHWVHVFYASGLAINVLWTVANSGKRAVGFKLCDGMDQPAELSAFKFARQRSKLAGTIRGSYFVIKGDYPY